MPQPEKQRSAPKPGASKNKEVGEQTARQRGDGGPTRRAGGGAGPAQEPLRDVEDDKPRERDGMERGAPARPGGRRRSEDPPAGKETDGSR
jgi:hypothetical protein